MQFDPVDGFGFETQDEKNEFLKTRIETLRLPSRVQKALASASIRTIGGIVRKSAPALLDIPGMGVKGLDEIQRALKNPLFIRGKIEQHYAINRPLSESLFETTSTLVVPTEDIDDVVGAFAQYFGVDRKNIEGPSRKKEIVEVRDTIVYFLRQYGDMSFPGIGRLLGNRDHTTIIHAFRKMEKRGDADPLFRSRSAELIAIARSIRDRKAQRLAASSILSLGENHPYTPKLPKPKEIPERNRKILELYREGLTLENIGNVFGVTRERVRQIVIGTVKQIATNEAISKGIVMDFEVLIEEESKRRRDAQEAKQHTEEKPPKDKRWSRYYAACRACGTTAIPHVRKGLCEQCVGGFRGERREDIIAQHHNECGSCGRTRPEVLAEDGRDFYITKSRDVLCRTCFLKTTGKKLGNYKNYPWSRFHPACVSCGTTEIPHAGRGLCENCSGALTEEKRERIIAEHGSRCAQCGITRGDAISKYNKDLHITKSGVVLCRSCFQKMDKNPARLKASKKATAN